MSPKKFPQNAFSLILEISNIEASACISTITFLFNKYIGKVYFVVLYPSIFTVLVTTKLSSL